MSNYDKSDSQDKILELVSFSISSETYALEINCIREIIKVNEITRVPNTPDFIKGVINLRGKVIPIIDMRKKLHLPAKEDDKNTRIIIVEFQNGMVGIIVDSVSEVLRVSSSITEPPPSITKGDSSDFIKHVGKLEDKLINILNLDYLLKTQ